MDIKSPKNYNRSRSKKANKAKKSIKKARNKTQTNYSSQRNINTYQGYNINFSGLSPKNKKISEEMMKDYNTFVKKNFGNLKPIDYMPEKKIKKILVEKDKYIFDKNIVLKNEKNYLIYEKFLRNNIDFDFGDEEIEVQIPTSDKFTFCEENRLGKNKNSKNDYKKRIKKLEKLGIIKNINNNIDNEILDENRTYTNPEEKKQ